MLENDCIPLTSPMPLSMRRASDETCVLLPRITPPLSQYRKRTSWRPRASAWATISSGVIGDASLTGVRRGGVLRGGHLLRDDLATERQRAVLDVDDGDALLGHMAVGRERDLAGDAREVLRRLDRGLDRAGVRAAGPLDRVDQQVDGVVPEGRERVLRVVPVLGLVRGDELLDALGARGRVHEGVRGEEHLARGRTRDLDEVRGVVAVAADDGARDAGVAELLDDRADVVRH